MYDQAAAFKMLRRAAELTAVWQAAAPPRERGRSVRRRVNLSDRTLAWFGYVCRGPVDIIVKPEAVEVHTRDEWLAVEVEHMAPEQPGPTGWFDCYEIVTTKVDIWPQTTPEAVSPPEPRGDGPTADPDGPMRPVRMLGPARRVERVD